MTNNVQYIRRRTPTARYLQGMWQSFGILSIAVLLIAGCSLDGLLGNEDLPDSVTDPAGTKTPKGALRAYYGAISEFRKAFDEFVLTAGLLTDELHYIPDIPGLRLTFYLVDIRDLAESDSVSKGPYDKLNRARGQASQAIGLNRDYAPDSLRELTAHLYSLQGYTELFLADLYCSGIPLSTLDYDGDYTYSHGLTSDEVYQHAGALFDTAMIHAGDSVQFMHLAKIGKARALLNLGRASEAAEVVSDVPDGFQHVVPYDVDVPAKTFHINISWPYAVGNAEGINGLDYISSGDPRTRTIAVNAVGGKSTPYPAKYKTDGTGVIVLASGIEARLIEAEARLAAGDPSWLDKLNYIRGNLWTAIEPDAPGPLPQLEDPGADELRLDLLYRERAFWLYLTGQRQGDLRRLIRQYGRKQSDIYPVGPYAGDPRRWYGAFIDLPVPDQERISNPLYQGCYSRN